VSKAELAIKIKELRDIRRSTIVFLIGTNIYKTVKSNLLAEAHKALN